jgi:hypothetical protein
MSWRFDPIKIDLVWTETVDELVDNATIDLGTFEGDITIDTGDRNNDSSIIDQGERII